MTADKNGNNNQLSSWKEIAAYLGVDERTCQRWEKKYGLPIRRMEDTTRSRVSVHKEDLDRWRNTITKNSNFAREVQQGGVFTKSESRHQKPIIRYIFVAVGILVVAAWLYVFVPRVFYDRQPSDFKIERSVLVILNKTGRELGRFDTKLENLESENWYRNRFQTKKFMSENGTSFLPCLMYKDINLDGRLDVLFCTRTEDGPGRREFFCLNDRGIKLWSFKAGREYKYGDTIYSADYRLTGFQTADCNGDGKEEILLVAIQWPEWPCQLALLDHQGNLLGEYWNSGYFMDMAFRDLNADGNLEILVSGCNNEYQKGCLVVFDPKKMNGGSPQTDKEYSCKDLKRGSEIFYILAPRTDVDMADINIPLESLNRIDLLDNNRIAAWTTKTGLIYEFTAHLESAAIKSSHSFEILYKGAFLAGKIKSELNKEYWENLKKSILYYDGKTKTWVDRPAMSNSW